MDFSDEKIEESGGLSPILGTLKTSEEITNDETSMIHSFYEYPSSIMPNTDDESVLTLYNETMIVMTNSHKPPSCKSIMKTIDEKSTGCGNATDTPKEYL